MQSWLQVPGLTYNCLPIPHPILNVKSFLVKIFITPICL